jgi:hypothetical protein
MAVTVGVDVMQYLVEVTGLLLVLGDMLIRSHQGREAEALAG